jgi:hypothetical protein
LLRQKRLALSPGAPGGKAQKLCADLNKMQLLSLPGGQPDSNSPGTHYMALNGFVILTAGSAMAA